VDSAAVQACLEASGECGPSGSDFACPEVIEGTVPAGGPCRLREECEGDAYCDLSTGACPGVCTPRHAVGMPCDSSDECSGGSVFGYCDSNGEQPAVCAERVFTQARGEGDACNLSGHDVALCPPGLFCDVPPDDTSDSTLGTCQRAIALGAACDDPDDVCVAGALCQGVDRVRTCQNVVRLELGDPCRARDENDPPSFCDPFDGLTCGEAVCEATGDGTAGSRCDTTDFGDLLPCDPGLYCDLDSDTCEPLRAAGAACDQDRSCVSGSCDQDTLTCRGEYCDG
jgi:hypothetical protein